MTSQELAAIKEAVRLLASLDQEHTETAYEWEQRMASIAEDAGIPIGQLNSAEDVAGIMRQALSWKAGD